MPGTIFVLVGTTGETAPFPEGGMASTNSGCLMGCPGHKSLHISVFAPCQTKLSRPDSSGPADDPILSRVFVLASVWVAGQPARGGRRLGGQMGICRGRFSTTLNRSSEWRFFNNSSGFMLEGPTFMAVPQNTYQNSLN